jgi:hypothetical protein
MGDSDGETPARDAYDYDDLDFDDPELEAFVNGGEVGEQVGQGRLDDADLNSGGQGEQVEQGGLGDADSNYDDEFRLLNEFPDLGDIEDLGDATVIPASQESSVDNEDTDDENDDDKRNQDAEVGNTDSLTVNGVFIDDEGWKTGAYYDAIWMNENALRYRKSAIAATEVYKDGILIIQEKVSGSEERQVCWMYSSKDLDSEDRQIFKSNAKVVKDASNWGDIMYAIIQTTKNEGQSVSKYSTVVIDINNEDIETVVAMLYKHMGVPYHAPKIRKSKGQYAYAYTRLCLMNENAALNASKVISRVNTGQHILYFRGATDFSSNNTTVQIKAYRAQLSHMFRSLKNEGNDDVVDESSREEDDNMRKNGIFSPRTTIFNFEIAKCLDGSNFRLVYEPWRGARESRIEALIKYASAYLKFTMNVKGMKQLDTFMLNVNEARIGLAGNKSSISLEPFGFFFGVSKNIYISVGFTLELNKFRCDAAAWLPKVSRNKILETFICDLPLETRALFDSRLLEYCGVHKFNEKPEKPKPPVILLAKCKTDMKSLSYTLNGEPNFPRTIPKESVPIVLLNYVDDISPREIKRTNPMVIASTEMANWLRTTYQSGKNEYGGFVGCLIPVPVEGTRKINYQVDSRVNAYIQKTVRGVVDVQYDSTLGDYENLLIKYQKYVRDLFTRKLDNGNVYGVIVSASDVHARENKKREKSANAKKTKPRQETLWPST